MELVSPGVREGEGRRKEVVAPVQRRRDAVWKSTNKHILDNMDTRFEFVDHGEAVPYRVRRSRNSNWATIEVGLAVSWAEC